MQVSNRVIVGAAAAFVALIAIVFFLLGRESARHQTSAPPVAMTTAEPAAPAPEPSTPVPSTTPPRAPAALSAEAVAVRDYFAHVDQIQTGPAGDPNELANQLLASAAGGDASGFDSLVKGADESIAKVRALAVPPACAGYHAKLLVELTDTATILRKLQSALANSDATALGEIAPAAMALQSRATALEAEARALKSRFGLSG